MRLSNIINKLLSHINIVVIRQSALNSLHVEVQQLHNKLKEQSLCIRLPEELHRELIRNQISQKWSLVDFMNERKFGEGEQLRQCPLCGHESMDNTFRKMRTHCAFGGGDLLRHVCPACAVIFGPDKMFRLTDAELSQEYEWHYRVYDEGDSTEQELRTFHALNPSKTGIYVNYGAGNWSRSVQQLRSEGWNVWAFEPHSSATMQADGLISSRDQLNALKFDGIFSNNVLEHLRYPERELVKIAALLKPDGRMAHATPCYKYHYEYTRFHLFFYPGSSRHTLLSMAGLTELEFICDGEFMCSVMRPGLVK
jgi:SAM-dependent methyltransferase